MTKRAKRRRTIGESPLDSLLTTPARQDSPPERSSKRSRAGRSARAAKPDRAKPASAAQSATRPGRAEKTRATFHIPVDLLDECRDAVVALSGPPERLTMARLAEDALRRELARLRKKHNAGERFPTRASDLRGGRPIGS